MSLFSPAVVRRSVRLRITWAFGLFVGLSMLSVALVVGLRLYSTLTANLAHDLHERARQDATLLRQRIDYLLESAAVLVRNPLVINGINDAQGRQTYLPDLMANFREGRDIHAVALVGYDGQPLYSTLEKPPTFASSRELRSALASGTVSYALDARQGFWIVFVPVSYYNTTQGAIVVVFDLSAVARRVLAQEPMLGHRLWASDALLFEQAVQSDGGVVSARHGLVEGEQGFLAGLHMELELYAPRSHYLAPAYAAVRDVALLGLVLTLAAVLIAYRIGFSIARPILLLRQRVAAADGSPERHCAPLGTGDELEDLAINFDRRTHELRSIQLHLEDLVASRTRELEQAKLAAEDASRFKSSFLANMSHEIRTPMNAILGLTHLIRQGAVDPRQRDHLDKVSHAAQHLLGIINDILDFSKVEAGKMVLEEGQFDVQQVLGTLADLLAARVADKGLTLTVDVDADVPRHLVGDALRLGQILLNLGSNAVKFTTQGEVRVRVSRVAAEPLRLRFAVSDTGIGLNAEQQSRLFQPFEQADASITRQYGGTGLGLAISRRLVELMQGVIGVESRPGEGSTFWFEIPLGLGVEPAATTPPAVAIPLQLAGFRVLLVEDNPVNQEVARALLEDVGLLVDVASDGREALEMWGRASYDLVLMDVQMPVMDGLAATRELRQHPSGQTVPVIALTANAYEEDRHACLEAGMSDFVAKPVDPELLYQRLAQWLPQPRPDVC